MSKVKCFHCHQHGHYATNCPRKKKNKQAVGSAGGEALASQFELDFSLIACLVSSVMGSVWFLDSGASFHMTGDRDLFSDLEDKDLGVHIEMGDDGRYSVTGIGTISFERESGKPFVLKEVMHVPGLKKNLISVAMLEDKGYDVVFSEGKAFMRSKTIGETRKIGV
ncbi:C2HC-type zinc finger protein [Stenotrophomonas sp.]|uniref:C2HC-type zinc finger protein n=1 Tax=Stenotrophomonas sp. TaxID=69392 RepID=UPI00199944B6|nr:C2HC-type zinc finger protein [Stenotrophomonas sp.]MBD3828844.1 zinc finger domain-containing protein [Stenotrophomonas sp.]